MTHAEVVAALAAGYPGVEWSYDGDGATLDAVPGVSYGLVWHGQEPRPTLDQLAAVVLPAPPKSTSERVAEALAAIENDPTLADSVKSALTSVVGILGS